MDLQIAWGAYDRYVGSGTQNLIRWSAVYPPNLGCLGFGGFGSPLPTGGIITDIEARVTLLAREYMARTIVDGTSYRITEMALGGAGYDVADPTQALVVNETDTQLQNEIFRKPIDQVEIPSSITGRSFVARFDQDSFAGGVGEIGLFAEVLSSPIAAEIGTKFLFAIAHMGLNTKTHHHVTTYRIFITI